MSSIEDLKELMTINIKQLYYPEDDLTKTPYALDVDAKIYKDGSGDLYLTKPVVDPTTQDIKTDANGNPIYDNTNITPVADLPISYPGDTGTILKDFIIDKALEYTGGDLFGNSDTYVENIYPYLNNKISNENIGSYGRGSVSDIFKFFYNKFFSTTEFDVNGYSLIFLYPPDFSGFKKLNQLLETSITGNSSTNVEGSVDFNYMPPDYAFYKYFRDYMMFAVEFDIPEQEVTVSNIPLANNQNIEFVSGFNTSGNLTVRYIDNSYLRMYKFHSSWISYMKMIMRGDLEPADEYIDSKEIDYMASMYFLKFTPNMDIPNYIGKASGIFPKNLPVKELLGTRTENQLVMYSINYFYSMYEGSVLTYNNESDGGIQYEDKFNNGFMIPKLLKPNAIYDEFNQLIMSAYSSSANIDNYRSTVDSILPGSMYDYKPFG